MLEPELMAGRYDAVIGSRMYMSRSNDPVAVLQSDFGCKGTYNLARFCDPAVDAELAAAAEITDVTQRRAKAVVVEAKVLSAGVYLPLVHEMVRIGRTKGVSQLSTDPLEWSWITHATTLSK